MDCKDELSELEFWKTDFISSVVYASIDKIEDGIFDIFSSTITCSPSTKVPVVCNSDFSLGLLAVSATNPIAPLDKPLTLEPDAIILTSENFMIVYVCISYKCKSNWVEPPVYGASDAPYEYTLACPIFIPLSVTIFGFVLLWLNNSIVLLLVPPKLMNGVPNTLLTLTLWPILNGTDVAPTDFVSLGFSTSKTVVPGK